jgi:hypothetical protein
MKQQIANALRIAALYGGQAVLGWTQIPIPSVAAGPTTPVVQVVAAPSGASVQAAAAGYGSLGLGHISWNSQGSQYGVTHSKDTDSFSIKTSVGLQLICPTAAAGHRASIAAVLQQPDPRYTVYLDQVALSSAPSMIAPGVLCGSTTEHTLLVKVPTSSSAGPVNANVSFQVTLQ